MAYTRFATRDASIIAGALIVWWLVAELSAGEGVLADFSGFVAGLLLGATGFVLHEWGHLLAALATRSAVEPAGSLRSSFIFSFDSRTNSLGQFLVMSVGGFLVTALVVFSFYVWLPDDLLASRVARGGALFLAFLGVTLELPLFVLAIYRRSIPAAVTVPVRRRAREAA